MNETRGFAAQHNYTDALVCVESWIKQKPQNRDFRLMRIRLLMWNDDFPQAERWMAAEKDKDAEIQFLRGELAFQQKDYPRAAKNFDKAAKVAPADSELQQESRRRWQQAREQMKPAAPAAMPPRVSPPKFPLWISGVQVLRARESQDWTEEGLAAQEAVRLNPNLALGVEGKTRTRSTPYLDYSDSAYGVNGTYAWNPQWGLNVSYAHGTRQKIYPGTQLDATVSYVWSDPLAVDLGLEHRAYAEAVRINLLHAGAVYETQRLHTALRGYLGFGSASSGTVAALLRTRTQPWSFEIYGSTGREESSRPYLQAGETIQGFYVIGIAGLWSLDKSRWRVRMGCERREERAFWHNGCELGGGFTL